MATPFDIAGIQFLYSAGRAGDGGAIEVVGRSGEASAVEFIADLVGGDWSSDVTPCVSGARVELPPGDGNSRIALRLYDSHGRDQTHEYLYEYVVADDRLDVLPLHPLNPKPARPSEARSVAIAVVTAALGVLLGVGGMVLWQRLHPTKPSVDVAAAVVAASSVPRVVRTEPVSSAVPASAASLPASDAVAPASATAIPAASPALAAAASSAAPGPLVLEARVRAALAQEGLAAEVRVLRSKAVKVDLRDATENEEARVRMAIGDVFAAAGLPAPALDFTNTIVKEPPRIARTPASLPSAVALHADGAASPAGSSRSEEPAANLLQTCNRQAGTNILDLTRTWNLARCMKKACCARGADQPGECREFDKKWPLNCHVG